MNDNLSRLPANRTWSPQMNAERLILRSFRFLRRRICHHFRQRKLWTSPLEPTQVCTCCRTAAPALVPRITGHGCRCVNTGLSLEQQLYAVQSDSSTTATLPKADSGWRGRQSLDWAAARRGASGSLLRVIERRPLGHFQQRPAAAQLTHSFAASLQDLQPAQICYGNF